MTDKEIDPNDLPHDELANLTKVLAFIVMKSISAGYLDRADVIDRSTKESVTLIDLAAVQLRKLGVAIDNAVLEYRQADEGTKIKLLEADPTLANRDCFIFSGNSNGGGRN